MKQPDLHNYLTWLNHKRLSMRQNIPIKSRKREHSPGARFFLRALLGIWIFVFAAHQAVAYEIQASGRWTNLVASVTIENIVQPDCSLPLAGSVEAVAVGGMIPYTYSWSNGQSTELNTNLIAGTYSVTVTDLLGQTATATVVLTNVTGFSASIIASTNATCFGGSNGSAAVQASNGVEPYTYQWSSSAFDQTTAQATNLPAGTHEVTVTDGSGCQVAVQVEIGQPDALFAEIVATTDETCKDENDGTATVNATGGVTPYTYLWSNGDTENTADDLKDGISYSVTITDAHGCTAILTGIGIDEPDDLELNAIVQNVSCFGGSDGAIDLSVDDGVGSYQYDWERLLPFDGAIPADIQDPQHLTAGHYRVTVADANGCYEILEVEVTQPLAPLTAELEIIDAKCEGSSDGIINVLADSGTLFDEFLGNPGDIITLYQEDFSNQEDAGVDGNPKECSTGDDPMIDCSYTPNDGKWIIVAGPAFSLTNSDDNFDVQNGELVARDLDGTLCFRTIPIDISAVDAADFSLTLLENANLDSEDGYAVSYSVDGGPFTLVEEMFDNFDTRTVIWTGITGSTLVIEVCISNTGSTDIIRMDDVIVTGELPLDYVPTPPHYLYCLTGEGLDITQSEPAFTGLAEGIYQVKVKDANGCEVELLANVGDNEALAVEIEANNPICWGDDIELEAVVSGGTPPYSYNWTGPGFDVLPVTDSDPTIIDADTDDSGTYKVEVTDVNGCMAMTEIDILVPEQLIASLGDFTDASCLGGADGTATVDVAGGASPYHYLWSNGSTDKTAVGLSAGNYIVTVTDANACESITAAVIGEPLTAVSVLIIDFENPDCEGDTDGSAEAEASGGTGPYTYAWSNGESGEYIDNLSAGTYNVTATDAKGCEAVASIILTDPTGVEALIVSSEDVTCHGGDDGSAVVIASGGAGGYSYSWSSSAGSQTTATATNLPAGEHTVTVQDVNGCEAVALVEIDEPAQLIATIIDKEDESCLGNEDGTTTVLVSGGTPPYSYDWDNDGTGDEDDDMTISGLSPGDYEVLVKDVHNCTVTATVTIASGPELAIASIPDVGPVCLGEIVPAILLSAVPNDPDIVYTWTVSGDNVGLLDGEATGLNPAIPSFVATSAEGSAMVTVAASLGAEPGVCTHSISFSITIVDDDAPTFSGCPGDITVNNDPDLCGANVNWNPPAAVDLCDGLVTPSRTLGDGPGSFFTVGSHDITYTATDASGNSATCSFTVTVQDKEEPDITCPLGFITFSADDDDDCTYAAPDDMLDAVAGDNCGIASLTHDFADQADKTTLAGAEFPVGTTIVTWTAEDAAGNAADCSIEITVKDDTPPVVGSCPENISVDNEPALCGAVVDYDLPTFVDNCDGEDQIGVLVDGLAGGALFPVGTTTVKYAYTDAAGNGPVYCTFTVTVEDAEDPEIECLDNIVVGADGSIIEGDADVISTGPCGVTLSYETPEGEDNCSNALTLLVGGVGGKPNYYQYGGTYTETYRVVDASGNEEECSFTIMVEDPVQPMITCPQEDIVVDNEPGKCSAIVIYATPFGSDNCPGYSIQLTNGFNSGAAFPVGTTEVEYTITDNAQNMVSCSFNVTVNDVEAPVIAECAPDQEVSTLTGVLGDCAGVIPDLTAMVSAGDNCVVESITQAPEAGTAFSGVHGGAQIITMTVADEAGNSTTCEVTLTLVDEEKPTFNCPADRDVLTSSNGTGDCSGSFPDLVSEVIPSDNCFAPEDLTVTQDPPAGTAFAGASGDTRIVTITVEDPAGNVETCDVTLTLVDDEAPQITTCPADQLTEVELDDDSNCISTIPDLTDEVAATDNCSSGAGLTITQSPTAGTVVNGEAGDQVEVTITVTDEVSNLSTCRVQLTIVDGVAPIITGCAPDQDVSADNNGGGDNTAAVPDLTGMVSALDPCNDQSILSVTQNPPAGSIISGVDGEEFEVVITVTDEDDNTATCTTTLTLIDTEVPTIISCATQYASISTVQGVDCLGAVPDMTGSIIARDNMTLTGGFTIVQSPPPGTMINGDVNGNVVIVFTVYDESNNSTTCRTTLVMLDDEPPVILECSRDQDVFTSTGGAGNCRGVVPDLTNEIIAEDACTDPQNLVITQNPAPGTFFGNEHEDELEVTITVTDEESNSATCIVNLTLIDDEAPRILCNDIPTVLYVNDYDDNVYEVEGYLLDPDWTDACEAEISHDYDAAPYSGTLADSELPVGETIVIWTVTDEFDNTDECVVRYLVNEKPCAGQTRLNLACNNEVYVTVGPNCESLITADMILEGTICPGLTDDYFIIRVVGDDANEINETEDYIANGTGTFIVEILPRDPEDFPIEDWIGCWGRVTVEDKSPPVVVNIDEYEEELSMVKREIEAQVVTGEISRDLKEGTINISKYSCFIEDSPYPNCERPYQTVAFTIDRTDVYTLELDIDGSEDGMLAIFRGAFNPENPCENIIFQNNEGREDDPNVFPGPGGIQDGLARMVLPLTAGDTYVALITYDDCIPPSSSDIDPWSLTLYSDNGGRATSGFGEVETIVVCRDLLCTDVNFVRNQSPYDLNLIGVENGGRPEFNDCTLKRVWFEDGQVQEDFSCGDIYFYRTWRAIDESGRQAAPVIQKIVFRKPTLEDVYYPPQTVPIECDDFQAAFMDDNGHPSPALTGYPFIVSAFGIHDLNASYCNLGASYQDISEITTCGNSRKFVRQWTLIDWCDIPDQDDLNNDVDYNYRQIIKLGDFTPPVVAQLNDVNISTGAFDCDGVFTIPAPAVTDNCSSYEVSAIVYKIDYVPLVDRFGRFTGETQAVEQMIHRGLPGDVLTNIEKGSGYRVLYHVEDICGNAAEMEFEVSSQDRVKPVAVCDDNLHVSIGGDGIGRVTALDVDEGSWDNCGPVKVYVSRKLPGEDIRDAYLERIHDLTMADLYAVNVTGPDSEMQVWKTIDGDIEIIYRKNGMWYTWWGPEIYFLCQDIEDVYVTVELLAVDGDGTLESYLNGEAMGNICWLEVLVEDKLTPLCIAPQNITLTCDDLPYGFDPEDDAQLTSMFGEANVRDNCFGGGAVQVGATVDLECGEGTITRVFQAMDARGYTSRNECVQVITVNPVHNYEIKFPKDVQSECANPEIDTVMINTLGCDLLTVNVYQERFDAVPEGNACYKIKRVYRVMNWCEYDGEAPPVKVGRNEDCDEQVGEDDVYVLVRPNGVTYYDRNNNENALPAQSPCQNGALGHLNNSLLDEDIESVGFWEYTQYIKVYDTSPPEVRIDDREVIFCSLDNVDCEGDAVFDFYVADVCDDVEIAVGVFFLPDPRLGLPARIDMRDPVNAAAYQFQLNGAYPAYTISGRFPIGDHKFEIQARDACANTGIDTVEFSVVDCKAPAPVCINGLSIQLMPVEENTDVDGDGDIDPGAVAIWASDFKVSNLEDCSEPVKLSINRVGETPMQGRTSIIFTCDDPDTLAVEIYAWDSAYNPNARQPDGTLGGPNYDFCVTYILLRDNTFNLCEGIRTANIAGLITTEEDETVEEVEVYLTGHMQEMMMTPLNGAYGFNNLPQGGDYTITSVKDNDYLNGVSTYDLVLITRHILGTKRLDSPYKMIAADVNNSGNISALDLIHLRKLILSVNRDLPGNTSWRFVPFGYEFPDPSNPWFEAFPQTISYNNVSAGSVTGDFVAVKIGDVNGSAKPNRLVADRRSIQGVLKLKVEDQELIAGQRYRVSLSINELMNIQGYQFTLDFDPASLELLDLEHGVTSDEHLGLTHVPQGVITVSWNHPEGGNLKSKVEDQYRDDQTDLFTLVFRAKANSRLSDLLRISSRYTQAEAYDVNDEILDVALEFISDEPVREKFELFQNRPNPFRESTVISFYLPEASAATLTVHDVQGRTVKVIREVFQQGYQEVMLNREDLPTSGILYYTLKTGEHSATRKMILMNE